MPYFTRRQCFPLVGALLGVSTELSAAELKPETISAFDRHLAETEARFTPSVQGSKPLWFDAPNIAQQLRAGASSVRPIQANGLIPVKGGLIQHWAGAVFVPKATLKTALIVAQDYPSHTDIYKPEIGAAKIRAHQNDQFNVYLRYVKAKLFLSAVFNTEHKVDYIPVDASRVWCRDVTTRIAEVNDAGKPNEKELPVGQDRGLLWRLASYRLFHERDGGVMISTETISLSRDIPFGMGKIMAPFVENLPGESLQMSLDKTRKATLARL